jgi:hypothetical protein
MLVRMGEVLLGLLVFLLLTAVFYALIEPHIGEKGTAATRDRDFVIKHSYELRPEQSVDVITTGGEYIIHLAGVDNTLEKCKGKPCVCVEEQQVMKCKLLERKQFAVDCSASACTASAQEEQFKVDFGKPVPVCRKGDVLHIGAACERVNI